VVEVAPASGLEPKLRQRLFDDAVRITKAAGYRAAGTVEFLVEPKTGNYFFIEVNPRVQVEHTVTEVITGIDIVQSQVDAHTRASERARASAHGGATQRRATRLGRARHAPHPTRVGPPALLTRAVSPSPWRAAAPARALLLPAAPFLDSARGRRQAREGPRPHAGQDRDARARDPVPRHHRGPGQQLPARHRPPAGTRQAARASRRALRPTAGPPARSDRDALCGRALCPLVPALN
jgi:hypothetical protein